MTKEMDALRLQLQAKSEDLSRSTAKMFREVDKAKTKVYDEAEVKFLERLEAREYNHQQKMKEFEAKIRAEFTKGDMFNARQQFYWAFDKWRMLTLMSKLQA